MNNQEVIVLPGWHGAGLEVGEMPSPFVAFLQLLERIAPTGSGVMLTQLETAGMLGDTRAESDGFQILENSSAASFKWIWVFRNVSSLLEAIDQVRPVSTTPTALWFEQDRTRDSWLEDFKKDPVGLDECSASSFANYAAGIEGCSFAVFADVFECSVNTAFLWHRNDLELPALPVGSLVSTSAEIAENSALGTDWSPQVGQILPPLSLAENIERWKNLRRPNWPT